MNKRTDSNISLTDLWHICYARRRWFAISVVLCLLIAVRYLIVTPYLYTRYATIILNEESMGNNATDKNGKEFNNLGFISMKSNVTDEVRRITSLDVLMEVAARLDPSLTDEDKFDKARELQSRLSAESDGLGSYIINLTYKDFSTIEAASTLNLIIEVYNDKWLQEKHMIIQKTSAFIDARLRLLEEDLNIVDDSISTYKSRYGITNLEHVSDVYLQQQSRADAEILTLTNQKAMAEYIRDLLDDKSSKNQLLLVNSGINNSLIESQITLYNNLLLQMQSHMDYTSGQNPLIVNLEKELNSLRKNIYANVNNHIRTIDIQLKSLENFHGKTTSKITSNPRQAKHLISIERDQKVKESLYMFLLQKKEENEIRLTYKATPSQIIDSPNGSGKPSSPKRVRVLIAAVLLGVLIPVAVIFLRASFDETVRTGKDITCRPGLQLCGVIPWCARVKTRQWLDHKLKKKPLPTVSIVVAEGLLDSANEAFRVVRTRIEKAAAKRNAEGTVLMVTSFMKGEGKTFIAMNLALTLAIHRKHVLFIDADLRQGMASRLFKAGDCGLTEYLMGELQDATASIFQLKRYPTLDILPMGTREPTPTELLDSVLFARLIASLRPKYDIVIIDTPQTDALADTEIIVQHADATLFVTRAGKLDRKRLDELNDMQQEGKLKELAVVLNGIEDYN